MRIVGEVFDTENNGLAMFTDWPTLAHIDHGLAPGQYDVALRPGTSAAAYVQALGRRLGPAYFVAQNSRRSQELDLMIALIGALTLLLAVVAGLGVPNTVVLYTREKVHDLGVFKAVGMTRPRWPGWRWPGWSSRWPGRCCRPAGPRAPGPRPRCAPSRTDSLITEDRQQSGRTILRDHRPGGQMKAPVPVIARPTIRVLISRVPS